MIWLRNIQFFFIVNYSKPQLWKLLKTIFLIIGAYWTLIEFLSFILQGFPTDDGKTYSDVLRTAIYDFRYYEITLVVLISLYTNRKKITNTISVNKADLEVEFKFCNLFEQEGSIVIPVMDTFDTSMDNNLVDRNTLHGKLISQYYSDKVGTLDNEISQSLTRTTDSPINNDTSLKGKKDKYSIGTTAIVQPESKYFYLTALTSMTNTGNVTIQPESIVDFLANLWQYIPTYGKTTFKVVNIPLIGKGINRLPAEYTHQRVAQEIANSFITISKQSTFCNKLRICIYPTDAKHINSEKLKEYINHLITYDYN